MAWPTSVAHAGPSAPSRVRQLLTVSAAVVAGTLVAVLGAGGSYALWNDAKPVSAGAVTSGSAGLEINDGDPLPPLDLTSLLPGDKVYTAFPVANIGDADLSVTASISGVDPSLSLPSHLMVTLAPVNVAGECTDSLVGGTQGWMTAFSTAAGAVVIAKQSSKLHCLVVELDSAAPSSVQGQLVDFTLDFDGVQVLP
ncbi:MAG TPA: TasA family protein [Homoserinimonas sp.]|nr:TasA family protein [Homoserinimonas sp.]